MFSSGATTNTAQTGEPGKHQPTAKVNAAQTGVPMPDLQHLLDQIEKRSHQALGDEPDPVADGQTYYEMWIDHQRQCAEKSQQDAQKLLAALRAVISLLDHAEEQQSAAGANMLYDGTEVSALINVDVLRSGIQHAIGDSDA